MTKTVKLRILDEVNCVFVGLSDETLEYFYNEFAVYAPNYYFNPKYKLGSWDGKIRFFHKTGKTYVNLLEQILPKIQAIGYKLQLEDLRSTTKELPDADVTEDIWAHKTHGESGSSIKLRPYQVDGVNAVIENGGGIILAGTGAGKAETLDSLVLTTNGWVRMGDITLDHVVITPDNATANVTGIYPHEELDIYEITFHDGAKVKCCEDHLWKVKRPKKRWRADTEWDIIDTKTIKAFIDVKASQTSHVPGNISIPLCDPIDFKESVTICPLDPYLLGVLLGDGNTTTNTIRLTTTDEQIKDEATHILNEMGVKLTPVPIANRSLMDYNLTKINPHDRSLSSVASILKTLGLHGCRSWEKFIPEQYKTASIDDRWSLIQGLMDTDGTAGLRNQSCTTVSHRLATDIREVIQSLGGICTIMERYPRYTYDGETKLGRKAYDLHISVKRPKQLFRLRRKQNRCRVEHSDGCVELMRRVASVEYVGRQPAQCIMIDHPEHLYITDDYIVTHNTLMNGVLVDQYGQLGYKTITIVPSQDLIRQTHDAFVGWGLDVGEFSGKRKTLNHTHIVSTWQTLQNTPAVIQQFDVVVVDECHGIKGNVLTKLLNEHGKKIAFRFGLTGTLPKADTDKLSVHVAVGYPQYEVPAHELISQGYLATLHIDIIQLSENFRTEYEDYLSEWHSRDPKFKEPGEKPLTYVRYKDARFPDYQAEKAYIKTQNDRLEWIAMFLEAKCDLGKGNVFCLVDGIQFGKKLQKLIPDSHFVYGKDEQKARKEVYDLFQDNNNLVVIATVNIASTGLNIERIFNMVFIDMGKSFIRTIQSIGRGLRKSHDKDSVIVTDICSDLKYGKRHLAERVRFYKEAKYPHKKKVVDYKED